MRNQRLGLGALALLIWLVAGLALAGCSGTGATPAATPAVQANNAISNVVSAEGMIVPAQHTTLAFKINGRVVEIPVHEGDTVKTGAVLARLDDASLQAQRVQAQAALTVAQKQLAELKAGAPPAERKAAQDALTSARAALAKVKAGPTVDELARLKSAVDGAEASLQQAQYRFDRIGGNSNPLSSAAAESVALQQAYIALASAQAAYRDAQSHPTESELRAAEAAVTQAESTIARLDPMPEALARSQAQVEQAQAALKVAEATAQDALLIAPFDGTVALVNVDAGQYVSSGAAVLSYANLLKLQVETKDLTEVDVAKVVIGQPANIKVDAMPDRVLKGQVIRIASVATDNRGDQVYKVTVALSENPETGLRWGMTTNVEIQVK